MSSSIAWNRWKVSSLISNSPPRLQLYSILECMLEKNSPLHSLPFYSDIQYTVLLCQMISSHISSTAVIWNHLKLQLVVLLEDGSLMCPQTATGLLAAWLADQISPSVLHCKTFSTHPLSPLSSVYERIATVVLLGRIGHGRFVQKSYSSTNTFFNCSYQISGKLIKFLSSIFTW